MKNEERRVVLREMLAKVNREWRELARASGREAKLSRMIELRSQRLAVTAEMFELDLEERRAS
jgi:hypothetical protein